MLPVSQQLSYIQPNTIWIASAYNLGYSKHAVDLDLQCENASVVHDAVVQLLYITIYALYCIPAGLLAPSALFGRPSLIILSQQYQSWYGLTCAMMQACCSLINIAYNLN